MGLDEDVEEFGKDLEELGEVQIDMVSGALKRVERKAIDTQCILIENPEDVICAGSEMLLDVYKRVVEKNKDKLLAYKDYIEGCYLVAKVAEIFCNGKPWAVGYRSGDDLELPRIEVTKEMEIKSVPLKKIGEFLDESVETTEDEPKMFTPEEQDNLKVKITLSHILPKMSERISYMELGISLDWREFVEKAKEKEKIREREKSKEKTQILKQKIERIRRKRKRF